ncbi:MAG: phosphoribosylamine--glycine ligase [Flavobacteriaceae bacterium]
MNILVLGSGGREHALCWKLKQSPFLNKLVIAPGNAGTASLGINSDIDPGNFQAVKKLALEEEIEMVVVGPEDPLVNGIHDFFLDDPDLAGIHVIGPQKEAARLEGSKDFAKDFMNRHQIPTAAHKSFTVNTLEEGKAYLETQKPPYVLKADGLAGGKGVLIIHDLQKAKEELSAMLLEAKFGQASTTVVVEEFLSGIELSCFVLTDGDDYKILPFAKDYKRIGEGDTGLNTGGMGAISPVPFVDEEFEGKIKARIVEPTIEGLKKDGIPYQGIIFIGLIKVETDPYVIEYNVRLGDPETEVVLPRIKSDLLKLFESLAKGQLEKENLELDDRFACTVMAVSGGYPGAYEKGKAIRGLDKVVDSVVFHAGTKVVNNETVTNGGRVMAFTSLERNMNQALTTTYDNLARVEFDGMNYRKDIGFDL